MRRVLAMLGRELRSYFYSPIAYIILTVFILRGVFIMAGSAESLRDTLAGVPPFLVCFLLPFLS